MVRLQPKPKTVRSANGSTEYGKPTVDLQVALSASSKTIYCAASDVNPFKIRCNLQITKATVNETQWWHVIDVVTNDVNWWRSEISGQKNHHVTIDYIN